VEAKFNIISKKLLSLFINVLIIKSPRFNIQFVVNNGFFTRRQRIRARKMVFYVFIYRFATTKMPFNRSLNSHMSACGKFSIAIKNLIASFSHIAHSATK
jgi:hypothetical protein